MASAPAYTPVNAVSPLGLLRVSSFSPCSGPTGSRVSVAAQTVPDRRGLQIRLLVGRRMCLTEVAVCDAGLFTSFTAWVSVPPLVSVDAAVPGLPVVSLELQLLDNVGNILDAMTFGEFAYTDESCPPFGSAPPEACGLALGLAQPLQTHLTSGSPPASPYDLANVLSPTSALHAHASTEASSSQESAYGSLASPVVNMPYGPPSVFSSSSPASSGSRRGSRRGSPSSQNGEVVRTEPRITFLTPLSSMTCGWTTLEHAAGRRLVRFERAVGPGGRVVLACTPVAQAPPNPAGPGVVVSCIAHPDGGAHVLTSFDVLWLAALLYGEQLQRGEKDRLRRHMERFAHRVVGKTRDTRGLFVRLSSFPEPRPLKVCCYAARDPVSH
jgi:hypothetical protein